MARPKILTPEPAATGDKAEVGMITPGRGSRFASKLPDVRAGLAEPQTAGTTGERLLAHPGPLPLRGRYQVGAIQLANSKGEERDGRTRASKRLQVAGRPEVA